MAWPRVQLFEFNDLAWVPASLRDILVETLGATLEGGGLLSALLPVLDAWLDECATNEVLDLCAGSGIPGQVLARAWHASGRHDRRLLLSDLYPRVEAWRRAQRQQPELLSFVAEPVDATAIAPSVSSGRARLILNAFHHFAPDFAPNILRAAVNDQAPIFIAEPFERSPLALLPLIPPGVPAMATLPLTSPNARLEKALWNWFTPIGSLVGLWDGVISSLRVYNERELRSMVEPFGSSYRWEYGTYDYAYGGRGYYFHGMSR